MVVLVVEVIMVVLVVEVVWVVGVVEVVTVVEVVGGDGEVGFCKCHLKEKKMMTKYKLTSRGW